MLALLATRVRSAETNTLLLEAEDFAPRGAWRRISNGENYYAATLANTFTSRGKLLSAPEQSDRSVATLKARIPIDGSYRVWTRYECPSRWSIEHTLRIEQNGRIVFERKYGALQNPKLWPFGKGIQSMVDWDWGSGDNIVWEPSEEGVELAAGGAKFSLIAERQPENQAGQRGAAKRNIDCIFLTTDLEDGIRDAKKAFYHLMDRHLAQTAECWLRITNPKSAANSITASLRVAEHNPYWQKRGPTPERIGARGAFKGEAKENDWLEPGASSPWIALGQALDTSNMQELYVTLASQWPRKATDVIIEFARDETGKNLLRQLHYTNTFANSVVLEVPGDLRDKTQTIRTIEECHRELLIDLKKQPARGVFPSEVPIFGIMGGAWGGHNDPADDFCRMRTETGLLLGRNTWRSGEVPDDLAARFRIKPQRNLEIDVRGTPTEKLEASLRQHELTNQILIVSMGDEIHVGGYEPENKRQQERFRDYLARLRSLTPEERVKLYAIHSEVPEPAAARLTKDAVDGTNFYWSQLFQIDKGIDDLKARTEIVERVFGTNVFTGANYAPHPHYWPRVGQWVRLFRRHGMTMPWAEDWTFQVPEVSMQVSGYLCDVFRCAAKYENLPIQFYTMPHWPGQTPRDLTLSFYSALAHGNKVVNFFAAKPIYDYTENYVSWEAHDTWRTIRELAGDVGLADDIIWNGRVRLAQVAVLLSHATDIYEDARGSSIYNFERKNLYLALRHAGVTVDFVTEEDVCEGWLERRDGTNAGYRVLYVCGDHMLRQCAKGIRDWVKGGGHLFSVGGGGFLDEFDQSLDTLKPVYGVTEQNLALTEKHLFAKEGLAWVRTLDRLNTGPFVLPALVARQTFTASHPNSGTLIHFSNGDTAGVVNNSAGQGTASIVGTFPGSAYIQSAIPKRPYDRGTSDNNFNHFLPTEFSAPAQRLILSPVRSAALREDIVFSAPLIDGTVIEAPAGYAVPLANYSGRRIAHLTVTLRNCHDVRSVISARHGKLRFSYVAGNLTVSLPVDVADLIVLRR